MTRREQLSEPPITEVICGLILRPIAEIDPLVLGSYWEERRQEFPTHRLQPPLCEEGHMFVGDLPPIRTWLVSRNEEFVLQIQSDRFYLNWRAGGGDYPRFSDHGSKEGLLSRLMKEFDDYTAFCRRRLGQAPAPVKIELTKVDHLVQGPHWGDFHDLAALLPWLHVFANFSVSPDPGVSFRFFESRDGGRLSVALDTAVGHRPEKGQIRMVKLETRIVRAVGEDIRSEFAAANELLNEVFFEMIPKEQRDIRFNKRSEEQ